MDATTTRPVRLFAKLKQFHANSTAPVRKDVQKLGLKATQRIFIQHILFNLFTACDNCESDFCSCQNFEQDPEYISCEDHFELIFRNCMLGCDHNDNVCYADCNREYDQNIQDCPCKSNCPGGCPCPNYECSQTTAAVTTTIRTTTTLQQGNSSVLVLSSFSGPWNPVRIANRIIYFYW